MKTVLRPLIALKVNLSKRIGKDYLKNKLKKRQGGCNKCGQCCKGCKFLDKQTNLCTEYKNRRILCYREFPLDRIDQRVWNVKNCGYHFNQ